MNVIQIAGHLGGDPVTRYTSSGLKVTTFSVAINVRKSGKDETVWYRVTIWGERFDKMLPYLKKGSAVIVVGELGKPDIWVDKNGQNQVTLEITAEIIRFSPFGKGDRSNQDGQQGNSRENYGGSSGSGYSGSSESEGEPEQGYAQPQFANKEEEEEIPF